MKRWTVLERREIVERSKNNKGKLIGYLEGCAFCATGRRSSKEYITSIINLIDLCQHAEGNILELGVAEGRNSILIGEYLKITNSAKNYVGFDTFCGYMEEDIQTAPNRSILRKIKESGRWDLDETKVRQNIDKAGLGNRVHLISGDLKQTLPSYLCGESKLISLLYIDCNAYNAAINGMRLTLGYMSRGSIICIDEHTEGGETKAIKEFAEEHMLKLIRTGLRTGVKFYIQLQQ